MNINYNERSWAIDVISEANSYLANKDWHFDQAGGEHTLSFDKKVLFPDVMLFKSGKVVMGWELKMPDTAINDIALIINAKKKAAVLKSSCFVLWNARSAVLYRKNEADEFELFHSWSIIQEITTRSDVQEQEEYWKALLFQVLEDLNTFLEEGSITFSPSRPLLAVEQVIDVVLENTRSTVDSILEKTVRNNVFEAELEEWWRTAEPDYISGDKYSNLAKSTLTDWVIKFIFVHAIKPNFNSARRINQVQLGSTPQEVVTILEGITEQCNFWNILSSNLGQIYLSDEAWKALLELHYFLKESTTQLEQGTLLQDLLEQTTQTAKRKIVGQYATPPALAQLLVQLTITDKTKTVWDPCCGTGTIAKALYQQKETANIPASQILDKLWASDKYAFPIQLSTLTLTKVEAVGEITQVFKKDVFDINVGDAVLFRNPHTGQEVQRSFPPVDYVVSNLPFVKGANVDENRKRVVKQWLQEQLSEHIKWNKKSDLFAYLPFQLYPLLSEGGRLGLVLSNAWLGTAYGELFIQHLRRFYHIDKVVVSGVEKWFSNADVVTTLLLVSKRSEPSDEIEQSTDFQVVKKSLFEETTNVQHIGNQLLLNRNNDLVSTRGYMPNEIAVLEGMNIPWSAYFCNLSWLPAIASKLVGVTTYFDLIRGERRGWNALFYPTEEAVEQIEPAYRIPLLKNLRATKGLIARPQHTAFCCSKTLEELGELGYTGTLNWIQSFSQQTNNSGRLLPEALRRPNLHWYEMTTASTADFAANLNYDKSLFIARLENRSFIDQRLIGLSSNGDQDKNLMLALLNSTLSLFFIEALGFGRGLGALDLSATKFKEGFRLLKVELLAPEQQQAIITAFQPLLERDRLPLLEELEQEDRQQFEQILMNAFGLSNYLPSIKASLMELYTIRRAVCQ